ncbi:helix-turn-helix transcriptional regulator [Lysinibacillus sp. FSL H8-0500]|uniref:helix-turn-helix domain-containing protein n=1 Tax=Lysinibacillus sp. FSL H8-0500 TaxID=2921393 RepID=UPI00310109D0
MNIGKKIQSLRNSKLWTQEQLAEMAGVSERTISRLENGEKIGKFNLQKIMDALNTSLEALEEMTYENEKQNDQPTISAEVNISYRINNARELMRLIPDTHMYGYDYHDCNTEEQVEVAQNFLTSVGDAIDIWSMLELAERFNLENLLGDLMADLEKLDLWVFGSRKVNKDNWATTIIEVYSKDNPLIQKTHLDASMISK